MTDQTDSPLRCAVWATPAGAMAAVASERGLRVVLLPHGLVAPLRDDIRARFPQARPAGRDAGLLATFRGACCDYFAGRAADFSGIALDLVGLTPFQRRVYRALRKVPRGRTVTYGDLARLIGSPRAARAVAGAMGRNPMPLIIPCHRVVGRGGALGGFSAAGGVDLKRRMLALEGVRF